VQWLLKCPSLLQTSHVHKVWFLTCACVLCPAARTLLVLVAGGIGYHSYGSIVELAAAAAQAVDTGAVDTGSGSGPTDHATKAALAVAAASILVKEALFHWTHAVGVRTASSVSAAHRLFCVCAAHALSSCPGSVDRRQAADSLAHCCFCVCISPAFKLSWFRRPSPTTPFPSRALPATCCHSQHQSPLH
jgi:hypothetical protein